MKTEPRSGKVSGSTKGRPVARGKVEEVSRAHGSECERATPTADFCFHVNRRGQIILVAFVSLKISTFFACMAILGRGEPFIK